MSTLTSIALAVVVALLSTLGLREYQHNAKHEASARAIATLVKDQGHDRAKIEQLEANATASAEAKTASDGAIADLVKRLDKAAGKQRDTAALAHAAEQRANRNAIAAQRARDALTQQREALYANDPTCAAWRAAPVCAGISHGLRIEWEAARSLALQGDDSASDRGGGALAVRADPILVGGDPVAASLASAYRWTDAIAVNRYSNGQMQDALSDALAGFTVMTSQLREIRRLGAGAAEVSR